MSKLAKATVGLMVATILSKLLGFARELVLASTYGASMYSDAYLTAINIPVVLFIILGTALGATFIPVYFEVENKLGKENSLKFTNNILNILLILSISTSVLGIIFVEPIVKVFAFGFDKEKFDITVKFTKILFWGITFSSGSYMMTSYLNAKENFVIPGLISVPRNIFIIVSMILSIKFGVELMIWGTLFGIVSEFIFQIPFAIRYGYKYKIYLNLKDKYIKKSLVLLGPVLIGVAVNQFNAIVDRALASTLEEGSISALNYANKLNGFVMAIFVASVVSVIYPKLSQLSSQNSNDEFKTLVERSINTIMMVVIPISVGAVVLSRPIVRVLFQRGAFENNASEMTSIALIMYSIGMTAFGLRDILGRVFISLQDTKTPMLNGIACMFINIILNIILIKKFKYAGLALATSLAAILSIVILIRSLKKSIGDFGEGRILNVAMKSIIASIVMGIIVHFTANNILILFGVGFLGNVFAISISLLIGLIAYTAIIFMLKVNEINIILKSIEDKVKIRQLLK